MRIKSNDYDSEDNKKIIKKEPEQESSSNLNDESKDKSQKKKDLPDDDSMNQLSDLDEKDGIHKHATSVTSLNTYLMNMNNL